jgi:hypothetical protein
MTYKADLEKRYAEAKARMYGSKQPIVDMEAVREAQEALWDRPSMDLGSLPKPASVGGISGPTGLVAPKASVRPGLTPLIDCRQSYYNMLRLVAKKHGLDPDDIQGPNRNRKLVAARKELWWTIRKELNYSFPRIAKLANRDHSTIIHAVQSYAAAAGLDSEPAQVQSA